MVANNPFTPSLEPDPEAAAMGRELLKVNAELRAILATWSEVESDERSIPHLLMGPLTVREMLLFIPLHDRHHVLGVRRRLQERG